VHLEGRFSTFARAPLVVTREPSSGMNLGVAIAAEVCAAGAREGEAMTMAENRSGLTAKPSETIGLYMREKRLVGAFREYCKATVGVRSSGRPH
jgi:hypothetical protein